MATHRAPPQLKMEPLSRRSSSTLHTEPLVPHTDSVTSRGEAESLARPVLAAYVTLGAGFAAEVAAIEAWLAAG